MSACSEDVVAEATERLVSSALPWPWFSGTIHSAVLVVYSLRRDWYVMVFWFCRQIQSLAS